MSTQGLDSDVSIGPKPIGAVANDSDNTDEYIGYLTFMTTGDVLVPRAWLEEQWEMHNLPKTWKDTVGEKHDIFPQDPTNWMAYRRAKNMLLDGWDERVYTYYNEKLDHEFTCKLELKKDHSRGSNNFILYSDVYFPEHLISGDDGNWETQKLGHFDFHQADNGNGGILPDPKIDKDNPHREAWDKAYERFVSLYATMQDHHHGQDLRGILDSFRAHVFKSVPIRRAVYFVGAHHEQYVEGLSGIWEEVGENFKDDGEEMRIATSPVVNMESQRQLVASRAEEMIQEMVDEIVDETLEDWREEEEKTAEETAREIMNQLSNSESYTAEYNQLLQTKLSVKDILQEKMSDFAEGQEEIIERVIDQQSLEEY